MALEDFFGLLGLVLTVLGTGFVRAIRNASSNGIFATGVSARAPSTS
jgi:hypothetical protein